MNKASVKYTTNLNVNEFSFTHLAMLARWVIVGLLIPKAYYASHDQCSFATCSLRNNLFKNSTLRTIETIQAGKFVGEEVLGMLFVFQLV